MLFVLHKMEILLLALDEQVLVSSVDKRNTSKFRIGMKIINVYYPCILRCDSFFAQGKIYSTRGITFFVVVVVFVVLVKRGSSLLQFECL